MSFGSFGLPGVKNFRAGGGHEAGRGVGAAVPGGVAVGMLAGLREALGAGPPAQRADALRGHSDLPRGATAVAGEGEGQDIMALTLHAPAVMAGANRHGREIDEGSERIERGGRQIGRRFHPPG